MTEHPDLKALLEDTVSDVEPRKGLGEIQARTGEDRHRRTWVWGAVAAVAATAATVAAVTVLTDTTPQGAEGDPAASTTPSEDPTQATPDTSPTQPASPTPTDEATAPAGSALPVYFVGDTPAGPRLFREFLPPTGGSGLPSERLLQALDLSIGGEANDPDLRSGWPGGGSPDGFNVVGAGTVVAQDEEDVISIAVDSEADVTVRPQGMSDDAARLALQQLVYTAQATMQERLPVQFTGVDGVPLRTLLGVDVPQPVTNEPEMQVQAPVWIITPQDGDDVGRDIVVEGRGAFFEANVSWQLLQRGEVVKDGYTTAEECCTLSPYSFTIRDVAPGYYELRVFDADVTGEGGAGEQQDTKHLTVR